MRWLAPWAAVLLGCSSIPAPALLAPAGDADVLNAPVAEVVKAELPSLLDLYKWFHANPEVSLKEEKTAERFAAEVRAAGWTVTERVGGFGVVAVLKNGEGPTVLARIDMDALPIKEETGLPYASTNGAMHACGHDVHLAVGIGLARSLARLKDRWSGTVILVGQPAEEVGLGAKLMLDDPKFHAAVPSKPAACLAIHDTPGAPAGHVVVKSGYGSANADTVDIRIFGRGGHGAWPHQTVDPIVIAAEMILAFQTIVSRKTNPTQPAVITVGSIHGGSKHNIIPDEVALQLTVRSYDDKVRERLLAEIRHVAAKIAEAHRSPRLPEIRMEENYFPAVYHDPALSGRIRGVLERLLGKENVHGAEPAMGAEDFGRFGKHYGVPGLQFGIGAAPASSGDGPRPGLHSNRWAPDAEPTLRTGTTAFTRAVLEMVSVR